MKTNFITKTLLLANLICCLQTSIFAGEFLVNQFVRDVQEMHRLSHTNETSIDLTNIPQAITLLSSDGQTIAFNHVHQSETLRNMLGDSIVSAAAPIPFDATTLTQLDELLTSHQQLWQLKDRLKNHQNITNLINAANYLEIPLIVQAGTAAYAHRVLNKLDTKTITLTDIQTDLVTDMQDVVCDKLKKKRPEPDLVQGKKYKYKGRVSPDGKWVIHYDEYQFTITNLVDETKYTVEAYPRYESIFNDSPNELWATFRNNSHDMTQQILMNFATKKRYLLGAICIGDRFSSDNQWYAYQPEDHQITKIIDLINENEHSIIEAHNYLEFSSNGQWCAYTPSGHRTTKIINLTNNNKHSIEGISPAFSPDNQLVATNDHNIIRVLNLTTEQKHEFPITDESYFALSNQWIAIGRIYGHAATTTLINLNTNEERIIDGTAPYFSPNGQWVITSKDRGFGRRELYNLNTKKQLTCGLKCVFSPNNQWVALHSYDNKITLINLISQEELPLQSHTIKFSPDSQWAVATLNSGLFTLFNLTTREKLNLASSEPQYANPRFNDDSTKIFANGRIMKLATLEKLARLQQTAPLSALMVQYLWSKVRTDTGYHITRDDLRQLLDGEKQQINNVVDH